LSERSGIGAVQVAVLEALAARPGRGFRSNEKLLSQAEVQIGLAPWYAYPVLVDLAQPWKMPVTLIEGQGTSAAAATIRRRAAATPSHASRTQDGWYSRRNARISPRCRSARSEGSRATCHKRR